MLAAAWLLPAFPLLLAPRFSARPTAFMFAPLAAALCYFAVRALCASWPTLPRQGAPGRRRRVPRRPRSARCPVGGGGHGGGAVVFAVWQIAERTEQIIYLRDPSTYLEVGYWIAHHGSLPIPDSLAAFAARIRACVSPAPTTTRAAPGSCRSS